MDIQTKSSQPPSPPLEPPSALCDDGEPPDLVRLTSQRPTFHSGARDRLPAAHPTPRDHHSTLRPLVWRPTGANLAPAAHIPAKEWSDWRWQIKNRLTTLASLETVLHLTKDERLAMSGRRLRLPVAVTPYYADLLAGSSALRRTMIPVTAEVQNAEYESLDPLAEENDSPTPGLVHRYPDRALFLATDFCAAYCRYCTRSRRVGKPESAALRNRTWDKALAYIKATKTIRDVVLSGGDPLTLPDATLDQLLSKLRAIPHLEMIRIGTKIPMVLPMRITPSLVRVLRKHHPLFMSIHCTHPDELTPEAGAALNRLADAGLPLGSQTVLLSGVNDDPEVMTRLMHGLLRNRVRPYYLYHCDQGAGLDHFRTPLSRGLDMIRALRGRTSGYANPQFVVDLPGGGGKIPLLPDYLKGREGDDLLFENYEGRLFRVHAPGEEFASCSLGGEQ